MAKHYNYRSAKNGQFVPESFAKKNSDTTVREAVKPKKKGK